PVDALDLHAAHPAQDVHQGLMVAGAELFGGDVVAGAGLHAVVEAARLEVAAAGHLDPDLGDVHGLDAHGQLCGEGSGGAQVDAGGTGLGVPDVDGDDVIVAEVWRDEHETAGAVGDRGRHDVVAAH